MTETAPSPSSGGAGPAWRIPALADPLPERVVRDSFVRDGSVTPFFRVLAHHPRLLARLGGLSGFVFLGGELPAREREIVVLRTLSRTRCEREFAEHAAYALDHGLSTQEIDSLAQDDSPPASWTAEDRALVDMADSLLAEADIADPVFETLRAKFGYSGILELIATLGTYRMIACIMNAARMPAEGLSRSGRPLLGPAGAG